MTAYAIEFPLQPGVDHDDDEATQRYLGQYVTLLMGGDAYLLKVTESHLMPGGQMVLGCERETPTEEDVPEPLELALQSNPVNAVEDGITYPCLPIACDADVRHLPGCVFAQEDGTPHFPAGESDG